MKTASFASRNGLRAVGLGVAIAFGLGIHNVRAQEGPASRDLRNDGRFHALAWMQNSAEYRLLCEQTYRLALTQLSVACTDARWCADEVQLAAGNFETRPPAVILDLDETVLDNSFYNARLLLDGEYFTTESWHQWCREEKSGEIPGALSFVRGAEGMGVEVFFITNREDEVKAATIANLKALGFRASSQNVLTKNPDEGRGDDKVSRRAMVAEKHRIVMLVGDSMSDLCAGMDEKDQQVRNATAFSKVARLGSGWIMMPNPVYGSWERALPAGAAALDPSRDPPAGKTDSPAKREAGKK